MDELLAFLFAAAIRFSGLPGMETPPPVHALPYQAMLLEICADLKADVPRLRALHSQCARRYRMMPSVCDELISEMEHYDQCTRQSGLMAAYVIEQHKIVYRDDLDLENDSDNSFIVHEYVHALQSRYWGDETFETCQGVLLSERHAYGAQQEYLGSRGQLLRVGDRLRFIDCDDIR